MSAVIRAYRLEALHTSCALKSEGEAGRGELTEMPLNQGEESSLPPLTQMAVELKKTSAEALYRLMVKECLRRKGGGDFFCGGTADSSPCCDVG